MRPLSIGEIADHGITLAVRHWRTLSVLVLIEALPIGVMRAMLPASGPESVVQNIFDILLSALLYPAAVLTANTRSLTPPGPVLAAAARRYGSTLLSLVVSTLWLILWLILTAIVAGLAALPFIIAHNATATGFAVVIAGGVAGLAFLPRAGLASAIVLPIVMIEHTSAWDALSRARRRVRHAGYWRASILGLALFAILGAPVLVVAAVTDTIVEATHLRALEALDEVLVDAISLGLGVVLSTVASLELRARAEGSDLDAALEP